MFSLKLFVALSANSDAILIIGMKTDKVQNSEWRRQDDWLEAPGGFHLWQRRRTNKQKGIGKRQKTFWNMEIPDGTLWPHKEGIQACSIYCPISQGQPWTKRLGKDCGESVCNPHSHQESPFPPETPPHGACAKCGKWPGHHTLHCHGERAWPTLCPPPPRCLPHGAILT
jgi:hypothetical protein